MDSGEQRLGNAVADAAGDYLRPTSNQVAVDQFGELINKYGSPVPGVGVDQMPELINRQFAGGEAQVGIGGEGVGDRDGLLESDAPSPRPSPGGRGGKTGDRLKETVENSFGAGIGRGRPATITPALEDRICTLVSVGFSRRQAAAYVDVDQSTIHRTAKRDPEFADRLKRAEEKATLQPMLTVISEAQKNWRAAAWLIQHKARQPVVLSEEEKQEQKQAEHEERLADARRRAEESKEWHRAMRAGSAEENPFAPPTVQMGEPQQTVRVKKNGKGEQTITRTITRTGRIRG